MKNCTKCKENRDITLFPKDRGSKDGYFSICKFCKRKFDIEFYKKNRKKILSTKKNSKESSIANTYRMQKKYPEKFRARWKLRYQIKIGKIIRPEYCDLNNPLICKNRIEAHHYLGYEGEHWKDVQWLCQVHHQLLHGILKYHDN